MSINNFSHTIIEAANSVIDDLEKTDMFHDDFQASLNPLAKIVQEHVSQASMVSISLIDRVIELSVLLRKFNQIGYSLQYLLAILPACENTEYQSKTIRVYAMISFNYTDLGNYDEATSFSLKRLELGKKTGDLQEVGNAYTQLGDINSKLGQHRLALEYFEKAGSYYKQTENEFYMGILYANYAQENLHLENYLDVVQYGLSSLAIIKRSSKSQQYIPPIAFDIAKSYAKLKQFDHAFKYVDLGLDVAKQSSKTWYMIGLLARGSILYEQGAFDKAIQELTAALEIATEQERLVPKKNIHEMLAQCYEATGNYKTAMLHLREFHDLYATQRQDQIIQTTKNLEVLHQTQQALQEAAYQKQLREDDKKYFKQLSRLQQHFVSATSHDLKNPLTTIELNITLIRSIVDQPPELEIYISRIERSKNKMIELVTNVLELAKLNTGRSIFLSSISLVPYLETITESFEPIAEAQNISLHTDFRDEDLMIEVDPTQFEQAMNNLVGNAIKYSEAGDRVDVQLQVNEISVSIIVKDSGRGIPEKALPHIFDAFYRVEQRSHAEREGTGLGLHITKHIVEQHGGSITVESIENEGSTFIVTLPRLVQNPVSSSSI